MFFFQDCSSCRQAIVYAALEARAPSRHGGSPWCEYLLLDTDIRSLGGVPILSRKHPIHKLTLDCQAVRRIKTLDFAGTREVVYERADWPLDKLQE